MIDFMEQAFLGDDLLNLNIEDECYFTNHITDTGLNTILIQFCI